MAYRSKTDTHRITLSHWATGPHGEQSVFTFRKHKYTEDDTAIRERAYDNITKIDPQAMQDARRQGKTYFPEVEMHTKKNIALATFEYMAVGWSGPEFEIPADADDPYAGQTAPLTAEYIDIMLPTADLEDIENELNRVWAGRSEDDQAAFRSGAGRVSDAGPSGAGSTEADEAPAA